MATLTYFVVGHITRDVAPTGFTLGGTATYSAITAARLGARVRILTACRPEHLQNLRELVPEAEIALVESEQTTTFENIYSASRRRQRLLATAGYIPADAAPAEWLRSDIIHLGPVAREVDVGFLTAASSQSLVAATPQGWLRRWDAEGFVHPDGWRPGEVFLRSLDALILSEEDVGFDASLLEFYISQARLTVVTAGYRGCTVYCGRHSFSLPPRPTTEVDPTGAGDVFAAAFLVYLRVLGDPLAAARYANIAGSLSVEGIGTSAIPTREMVERTARCLNLNNGSG